MNCKYKLNFILKKILLFGSKYLDLEDNDDKYLLFSRNL
jgi:hypothetical protein